MFSVYLCNSAYVKDRILIYADERSDEDELKLISPKLTMEVNQAGSFEFGIPVGNAGYDDIEPMISEILVMREDPATVSAKRWRGGILWFGRVLSITTDVWNTKQCYCEGGLSYLNDVIATSFSTSRNLSSVSIGEALMTRTKNSVEKVHYNVYPDHDFSGQMRKYCLTNYGSNVKDHYLKYLGFASYYEATKDYIWTVEPVIYQYGDDTEHYYQRKQGLHVWNDLSILELIANVVGDDGYYWMEKGEVTVDDYTDAIMVNQLHLTQSYAEFNEDRHQTFRIGENIIDFVKEDDMTDIYTAVHPYGTADGDDHTTTLHFDTDEEYTTTNKQIKLKYSKDYPGIIYRPDMVKRYGMVVKNLDVGTYYAQEQLIAYTLSYFDSQNLIETTIENDGKTRIVTFRTLEIKAADMGMMGADYSMIQLMDPVHVVSEIHDVDLYANVTKIEIDLQSPENSIYTINSSTTGSSIYNGTGSSVSGGSTPAGSSYRHPRHTAHELGLWKIENDNLGHVTNAQAVNKKDITDLGIPGEDTFYTYIVRSERSSNDLLISTTEVKNGTFMHKLNAASFRWDGNQSLQNGTINFGGYLFGTLYDGASYPSIHEGKFGTELSVKITPEGDSGLYGCASLAATFNTDDGFTLTSKITSAPAKWDSVTDPTCVKIGYNSSTGTATLITDFANDILVHNVINQTNGGRVTGEHNLVEGAYNTVSGDNNLVGGSSNKIATDRCCVTGQSNEATEHAYNAAMFGYALYCDAANQVVLGRYNAKDPGVLDENWNTYYGKYVLIVGNGGNADEGRSNAFAVDWDGNLWCGNDTTSLNAQIKSKAESTELAKYLPLTGGTMIGDIDMATNGADLLVGTQRSVRHGTLGTAIAGGAVDVKTSFADGLKARKSIVGTYTLANGTWVNLISVRHRNGYGDGINYGMYIYSLLTSGGNLIWNKQTAANTWQGERVLLDSANYTSYALAKDGTAKKAELLTETSWTALPNTYAASMTVNTLKYKKVGQIVFIRGGVKFTNAQSGPLIGVLPSGYRPDQKLYKTGWSGDKVAAYGITVGSDGFVALQSPSTSAGWFDTTRSFFVDISFCIT